MNFHIAYLLTKHECVIIPDFGAFIASGSGEERIKEVKLLCAPAQSLGFNPAIKHNDGLLANFISTNENSSYTEAGLKIQRYVDALNNQLVAGRTIHIQWVGRLSLSAERKIIFTPSHQLSCNAGNFGFCNFYIPTIREVEKYHTRISRSKKKKENHLIYIPVNKQMVRWAGSAAAAILAMFVVSTPVNEHATTQLQQTSFFPVATKPVETAPLPVAPKEHYIIIANSPSIHFAKKDLEELRKRGFPTAEILETGSKILIYVDKFDNRPDAEVFLRKFKADHPQHTDAWMFIR
ncbi:MAG: hypothetical protein LBO74_07190 [Candidatus Symbiothrix sp.]|jgi:hypothetical protein|nr:hypothetical protein [Candidatus Symbiothrix sp.]